MYPQRESLPGVTAAGIVAIIFASLGILGCGLVVLVLAILPNLPQSQGSAPMPEETRMLAIGIYAFFLAICVGEMAIAINVLRRKNWARIAILVWAGVMAAFSAMICVGVLFSLSIAPQAAQKDPGFQLFMKFFLLVLCGIPFGVSVWWLVLFTRPRVAAAFTSVPTPWTGPSPMDASGYPVPQLAVPPPAPAKPSCPVPVLIVAVLLLFSAVWTPLAFLIRSKPTVPLFFFGYITQAPAGRIFMACLSLTFGILAIGMIRLKPIALDALILLQAIFLVNGIASLFSPTFLHSMQEAMHHVANSNPNLPPDFPGFSERFFRIILIGGLLFSQIVLGVLIGFRTRFQKAAESSRQFA